MHMVLMVVDGIALMLGSLLAASLLTSSAWMIADRMHRPWVALVLLAAVLGGMLASPMEQSLFVRMVTVFAAVGTVVLSVVVLDRSSLQGSGREF